MGNYLTLFTDDCALYKKETLYHDLSNTYKF